VGVQIFEVEVVVRVTIGIAVACSSATPRLALDGSPLCASECIETSAPAPNAIIATTEPSVAFADMELGRDAKRALRDREASSAASIGCGGSGVARISHGSGFIQISSRLIPAIFDTYVRSEQRPSHLNPQSTDWHDDVDHHKIDRPRFGPLAVPGRDRDQKPTAVRNEVRFDVDRAKRGGDGLSLVLLVLGEEHTRPTA
jgi:hypothetical protein